MTKRLFFLLCLLATLNSHASDSLTIVLNGDRFQKGDTISFDCIYRYSEKKAAASTLNVWIEDITKNRKWQYRYPLVNGQISANLAISPDLPDGKYALNFLVQNQFFGMKGKIRDYNAKTKGLIYIMLTKNKDSYLDNLKPNPDGSFSLPKLQFADSARFIFSQVGKKKNDLFVDISTPLDSTFTPAFMTTRIITVGNPTYVHADTARPYVFNEDIFKKPFTIEGVTVTALKKKKIEQFDKEYSNGLFSGGDAKIFDGIDGHEISDAVDIFMFLQGRVAGLNIGRDSDGGMSLTWRGTRVALFLDEFRIEPDEGNTINPADVAMIKVFSPGGGGPTNGGAIAIYTKRGSYADANTRKYYFIVKGFTPADSEWR